MDMPLAVVTALNAAVEKAFAVNDEAQAQLHRHVGGVITVVLSQPSITVHAMVLEHTVEFLTVWEDLPDATVHTDLAGIVALSRGTDALLSGKARVRGDLKLVEGVHRAVTLLATDWEDQLAPFVGDTAAHKIAGLFNRAKSSAQRNHTQDRDDVTAYLQREAKLLVSRDDWRALTDSTDHLRQGVDRLAARLDLMARGN